MKYNVSILKQIAAEKLNNDIKGIGHDFCWSGKPIYHFWKQGNICIFQNK